ncbi:hypothetical protein KS4_29220 [Poriferisphaera corsica]|uniref:Uncharacterized protein n=1 Tax=Poriferisphaera corsica TaxID=2528020 RepID=A0A517YX93_9BACT|nr:hypothetical protein KS4_29220 [Poriferisphaera corsica]
MPHVRLYLLYIKLKYTLNVLIYQSISAMKKLAKSILCNLNVTQNKAINLDIDQVIDCENNAQRVKKMIHTKQLTSS